MRMLERLGEELGAERSYLFSARGEGSAIRTSGVLDGISSQIESLQDMDYRLFERWLDLFGRGECVLIEDLDAIKGVVDPREYETLLQEIASLVVAPIERDGRLVGFLGMDNPPADQIRDIALLLRTLCYFYSMTLQRIENERQLVAMSYHDSLTGLYNRNRYNEDVRRLESWRRLVRRGFSRCQRHEGDQRSRRPC